MTWVNAMGFMNGTSDIIHEPYPIKTASWSQPGFDTTNPIPGGRFPTTPSKFTVDYDNYTQAEIETIINNHVAQGSDPHDVAGVLKQLFAHVGTKNTFFTAQGHINSDGVFVWHDLTTGNAAQFFRRTYVGDDKLLNRFKYISDEEHDASKLHDDTKRFWFSAQCPGGLTSELGALAKSLDIIFVNPATVGWKLLSCTAFGTDAYQIAANVKTFLAACKA